MNEESIINNPKAYLLSFILYLIGVIIYRMAISDAYPGPQSKQKMIAIVSRSIEIFQKGAKESINLEADGPIKLSTKYPKGRKDEIEIKTLENSIELLMRVPEFEVSVPIEGMEVIYRYNETEHYGRAMEIRIKAPFKESMDKYAAGFVLLKDILTSSLIYEKMKSRATRLRDLVRSIAKKFLGDAYSEDFREIKVHQFRRDRVYFNFFGYIFSVRTRWEE